MTQPDPTADTAPVRIPIGRNITYAVRGMPPVPNAYGSGFLVPTEVSLTYRASEDSQLGRFHAYVKGQWRRDGELVPTGEKLPGQHYSGDPSGWPEWLAEEARLHDPEPAVGPPVDRAAVYTEVADRLAVDAEQGAKEGFTRIYRRSAAKQVREWGEELRRMADETQPATVAKPGFVPSAHYRRDDGVECCVHTVPVGPDSCPACRELADAERPAAGPNVLDEVVAALQAKAQALSVEAEEEMRRDLEEQAQVWHEAADLARRAARKAARGAQAAVEARQDGAEEGA